MKEKISSTFKTLLFLSIGFLLVWWVVKDLDKESIKEIKTAFSEVQYGWLVLSAIMGVLSHLSRSIRWKMLLKPLGYSPGLANTFYAVMVGYMANLAFPRLGEITKCALLNKYENIPVHQSIGTIFVDRIMDLITLALILLLVILTQFDLLYAFTEERLLRPLFKSLIEVVPDGYGIVVGVLSIAITIAIFYFLLNRFKDSKLINKFKKLLLEFSKGLTTVKELDRPFLFIFHSLFIWVMYFMMTYVSFQCLEVTSGLGINPALAVLVFGTFAFIIVQGGIGAYPVAVMEILSFYAIPATLGFAFGWILWGAQTVLVLLLGVFSLAMLPLANQKKKHAKA